MAKIRRTKLRSKMNEIRERLRDIEIERQRDRETERQRDRGKLKESTITVRQKNKGR